MKSPFSLPLALGALLFGVGGNAAVLPSTSTSPTPVSEILSPFIEAAANVTVHSGLGFTPIPAPLPSKKEGDGSAALVAATDVVPAPIQTAEGTRLVDSHSLREDGPPNLVLVKPSDIPQGERPPVALEFAMQTRGLLLKQQRHAAVEAGDAGNEYLTYAIQASDRLIDILSSRELVISPDQEAPMIAMEVRSGVTGGINRARQEVPQFNATATASSAASPTATGNATQDNAKELATLKNCKNYLWLLQRNVTETNNTITPPTLDEHYSQMSKSDLEHSITNCNNRLKAAEKYFTNPLSDDQEAALPKTEFHLRQAKQKVVKIQTRLREYGRKKRIRPLPVPPWVPTPWWPDSETLERYFADMKDLEEAKGLVDVLLETVPEEKRIEKPDFVKLGSPSPSLVSVLPALTKRDVLADPTSSSTAPTSTTATSSVTPTASSTSDSSISSEISSLLVAPTSVPNLDMAKFYTKPLSPSEENALPETQHQLRRAKQDVLAIQAQLEEDLSHIQPCHFHPCDRLIWQSKWKRRARKDREQLGNAKGLVEVLMTTVPEDKRIEKPGIENGPFPIGG